jgi:hypothetical protein
MCDHRPHLRWSHSTPGPSPRRPPVGAYSSLSHSMHTWVVWRWPAAGAAPRASAGHTPARSDAGTACDLLPDCDQVCALPLRGVRGAQLIWWPTFFPAEAVAWRSGPKEAKLWLRDSACTGSGRSRWAPPRPREGAGEQSGRASSRCGQPKKASFVNGRSNMAGKNDCYR